MFHNRVISCYLLGIGHFNDALYEYPGVVLLAQCACINVRVIEATGRWKIYKICSEKRSSTVVWIKPWAQSVIGRVLRNWNNRLKVRALWSTVTCPLALFHARGVLPVFQKWRIFMPSMLDPAFSAKSITNWMGWTLGLSEKCDCLRSDRLGKFRRVHLLKSNLPSVILESLHLSSWWILPSLISMQCQFFAI